MNIDILSEWSTVSAKLAQANLPKEIMSALGQFDQYLQLVTGQQKLDQSATDVAKQNEASIQSIQQSYQQQVDLLNSKIESLTSQLGVIQTQRDKAIADYQKLAIKQQEPPPDNIIGNLQEHLASTMQLNEMLSQQNTLLQQEIDRLKVNQMGLSSPTDSSLPPSQRRTIVSPKGPT